MPQSNTPAGRQQPYGNPTHALGNRLPRGHVRNTAPTIPSGLAGANRRVVADMTERTTEHATRTTNSIRHYLFVLTPGQWQTLDDIGITAPARQLLEACDHLVKHYDHYPVNQRLDTIAAIPEHPADWRHWWVTNRNALIGVFRPQDHDPKQDTVSETLNGVIAAIGHAALSHLPKPADFAAGASPETPARLSTVWADINSTIGLAYRLGIGPEAQAHYPADPESIAAELAAAGISHTIDMGRLEHPVLLREQPHWPGINLAYCSAPADIWWPRDAVHNDRMVANRLMRSRPYFRTAPEAEATLSQSELRLIQLTTPQHPEHDFGQAETLAFRYRITPKQTIAILASNDEAAAETPPPCPQAGQCPAICGYLQRTGETAFPANHSGEYQDCHYSHFLTACAGRAPEEREAQAQRLVDKIINAAPRRPKPETPADSTASQAPQNRQTMLAL